MEQLVVFRGYARMQGGEDYPNLRGTVRFYQQCGGVLVSAQITGLPRDGFFGIHIHAGERCAGKNFGETGGHYDPASVRHPHHAGDLPPLLSTQGRAKMTVLTDSFRLSKVIGKTVVIHEDPDDFKTQPSGNAGRKIACGIICRC